VCLRESYALCDLAAFPHHIVAALRRAMPAECAWYDAATPTRGRTAWVVEPFDTFPDAQRVFSEYMHEHPCFLHPRRISDGRSWRLSDYLSRHSLHRLGLYNEYYIMSTIDGAASSTSAASGSRPPDPSQSRSE